MDWEQLTIIAQIATGVATLAVAAFLASQLRQQHRDSEREILYTSNELYTNIMGRIVDPQFGPIFSTGTKDYDSLTEEEEIQFRIWNQISSINQAVNFRAGHEGLDRGIDSRIYEQSRGAWTMWPGMATYYECSGFDWCGQYLNKKPASKARRLYCTDACRARHKRSLKRA